MRFKEVLLKIFKIVASLIISFGLCYIIFAFCSNECDTFKWSIRLRSFYSFFSIITFFKILNEIE